MVTDGCGPGRFSLVQVTGPRRPGAAHLLQVDHRADNRWEQLSAGSGRLGSARDRAQQLDRRLDLARPGRRGGAKGAQPLQGGHERRVRVTAGPLALGGYARDLTADRPVVAQLQGRQAAAGRRGPGWQARRRPPAVEISLDPAGLLAGQQSRQRPGDP